MNAPNAPEFIEDFKRYANEMKEKVRSLIQANKSNQYLQATDHAYFTAMNALGTSGATCLQNITAQARVEAATAEAKARQQAADEEAKAEAERQKKADRDAAAEANAQKKEQQAQQKQERADKKSIDDFNRTYAHNQEWERLLGQIEKEKVSGSLSSDALHKQIEADLSEDGQLAKKLRDYRHRKESGVDLSQPSQQLLITEIKTIIAGIKRDLDTLGYCDATLQCKYSRLEADLQNSENAAAAIQEGDACMPAATELIKHIGEVRDKLAAFGFDFESLSKSNEVSRQQLEAIEQEISMI